ncbi:hypothetical protein EDB86DRAFT_487386 [Lactarius hatsudake]|nr:hypothetical protein EDB86DRAFT_487386 [Lactarius hatsudake]
MGDPGNLLIQTEGHPTGVTARSEAPNLWDPCLPDLLCWQYLAHIISQPAQETPSIISGPTNPCTLWPQSVNGSTTGIAILSQSQIPEKTPPTFAPRFFYGSLGNQAISEAVPNCHTLTRHDQPVEIQEGQIRLARRQPERGIEAQSTPGGNVRLQFPHNANTSSSDVCDSQIPQQQWEGLNEIRQDPVLESAWNSENCSKTPRGAHHCTDCGKVYRRPQELKRHNRDRHEWQRRCPFCCTRWSRPERIRAHLMKQHESRLTKDQQQEIRLLRGRDDTVRFLEKYSFPQTTHPTN